MTLMLVHIVAGLSAIVAGLTAVAVTKGGSVHRRAGMVFVCAMAVMATMGAVLAADRLHMVLHRFNVAVALLSLYLVGTSLLTVRPLRERRRIDILAACVAGAVATFFLATIALAVASGKASWFPIIPALVFTTIAILGVWGDVRLIRAGGIAGNARLARHLWRMCAALVLASAAFLLGQAKVLPPELRIFPLLALPPLAVLGTMAFYLVRLRSARRAPRVDLPVGSRELTW